MMFAEDIYYTDQSYGFIYAPMVIGKWMRTKLFWLCSVWLWYYLCTPSASLNTYCELFKGSRANVSWRRILCQVLTVLRVKRPNFVTVFFSYKYMVLNVSTEKFYLRRQELLNIILILEGESFLNSNRNHDLWWICVQIDTKIDAML